MFLPRPGPSLDLPGHLPDHVPAAPPPADRPGQGGRVPGGPAGGQHQPAPGHALHPSQEEAGQGRQPGAGGGLPAGRLLPR